MKGSPPPVGSLEKSLIVGSMEAREARVPTTHSLIALPVLQLAYVTSAIYLLLSMLCGSRHRQPASTELPGTSLEGLSKNSKI